MQPIEYISKCIKISESARGILTPLAGGNIKIIYHELFLNNASFIRLL